MQGIAEVIAQNLASVSGERRWTLDGLAASFAAGQSRIDLVSSAATALFELIWRKAGPAVVAGIVTFVTCLGRS